ncbi:hypothetical protein VdG1_03788 [Verticillium dahliae VDG1]|nr:hypothetical protein VdG1_03788 [Verticillium dahliae VDG1]
MPHVDALAAVGGAGPAPAPAGAPQQPPQQGGFTMSTTQKLLFGFATWSAMNFGANYFLKKPVGGATEVADFHGKVYTVPANLGGIPPYVLRPKTLADGATFDPNPARIAPMWPLDSHIDIIVTLSDSPRPEPLAKTPADKIVLRETNFHLGNYSDKRSADATFTVPASVQHNVTLWGHFYLALTGEQPDPYVAGFDVASAYHFAYPLTQYLPKKKVSKTRSLLDSGDAHADAAQDEEPSGPVIASYYHPNITLSTIPDSGMGLMSSIELSSKETARQAAFGNAAPGGGDGTEVEMVKEILLDSNPYLLAITAVVTVAHIILEMLAFGSDIAHYRKKKDNVGISVRSILANAFMQAVILLYLIDNSENTSWVILGSQAMGILIELWKITTVVNVRFTTADAGALLPYRVAFEDKHKLSDTEEKTKEYDEIAFKYMYMAGVPLLIAYAVYSLVYDEHKSWYSYMIATLVGSVYAYGFLMMVPSLYINYRLKSVAHMPAKAMMYKFLNTFIDDLFAFTIKMPILHRLATFRDDVIFFVYIYQRWAYATDYSRVNEFGQGGGEDDDEADRAKAKALLDGEALLDKQAEPIDGAATHTVEAAAEKASGADKGKAKRRR